MKITVPIATRGGNRLLMLRDFLTDQVRAPWNRLKGRDQLGDRLAPGVSPGPPTSAPPPGTRAGRAFSGKRRREGRLGVAESVGAR